MFTKALLFGAFAAYAFAQSSVLTFTHVPNPITDGEPQAILYSTNDTQSPVTIVLRKGQSNNLQTISTLTTSSTGGQYIWTPAKSLADDSDYALEIKQGNQVNYYGPFIVQGASPSAVSAASKSSATSTSSSSVSSTGTANATMTSGASANGTTTTGSTGNSTMTMTSHNSTTTTNSKHMTHIGSTPSMSGPASTAATTSGAPFQGSSTAASSSATSTGGVSSDMGTGSSLALAFGAIAVVLLH